jgi:hypothetical protein
MLCGKAARMTEETKAAGAVTPPDHLSINPMSPHFDGDLLSRGVGIRFKGEIRTTVEEYGSKTLATTHRWPKPNF